jgi:hypothetical protein
MTRLVFVLAATGAAALGWHETAGFIRWFSDGAQRVDWSGEERLLAWWKSIDAVDHEGNPWTL